jgi:cytochrome P450
MLDSAADNPNAKDDFKLSNSLIMQNALSFVLAGHDTTANACTWVFYALAKDPALQELTRDEVREVCGLGAKAEDPTWATLGKRLGLVCRCGVELLLYCTSL